MKRIATCILLLVLVAGCATQQHAQAIAKVNSDIEAFNQSPGVLLPIERRVAKIVLSSRDGSAKCVDENGHVIVELTRQPDGSYKGQLMSETFAPADAGESETLGHWYISHEVQIEKEMF